MEELKPEIPKSAVAPSIPEEIFRQANRSEITREDANVMTAAWIAENLPRYSPLSFPPLSDFTAQYVRGRLTGNRDYAPDLSAELNNWFQMCRKIQHQNLGDIELIDWAIEKTRLVKLTSATDRLVAFRRMHESRRPHSIFHDAMTVLAIDSKHRYQHRK